METNDAATAVSLKDVLIMDYELKVRYLTDHFGRMWTRFNYFVGIESAHAGGKLILGNGKLSPEVAIVGMVVSLFWYVMGAEDPACRSAVGCFCAWSLPTGG
jgi:hypothetical protein